MKTVEQIKNEYAKEQGYESYRNLVFTVISTHPNVSACNLILSYENAVIQLIQDELKKKIANIEDIKIEHVDEFGDYIDVIGTEKETILNTENIK